MAFNQPFVFLRCFLYRGIFKPWVLTKENLERSTPKKEDPIKIQDFGSTEMASFSRTPLKKSERPKQKNWTLILSEGWWNLNIFQENFTPSWTWWTNVNNIWLLGHMLHWTEFKTTLLLLDLTGVFLCVLFSAPRHLFTIIFFRIVFLLGRWISVRTTTKNMKTSPFHLLKQKKSRILHRKTKQHLRD